MLVTLLDKVMDIRLSQFPNAPLPILVTPLGKLMVTRLLQSWNAPAGTLVYPLGMVTEVPQAGQGGNVGTVKIKCRYDFKRVIFMLT